MDHAGILVDLAEQVLAVDQLQPPAPERLEVEAEAVELRLLPSRHEPDQVGVVMPPVSAKHFRMPSIAPGPGTTNSISVKSVTSL